MAFPDTSFRRYDGFVSPGRHLFVAFILFVPWQPAVAQQPDTLSSTLETIVVTATRDETPVRDLALSNGRIGSEELSDARPAHPSEVLGRVAGVWVNQTSGEGHMTAIRQPLSLSPVYLFLEDGIPTRSTGFFNQNALNEVNIPGAGSVEILKGAGTALHGSDAVAGVINVISPVIPAEETLDVSTEAGSFGYRRLLVGGGVTVDKTGFQASLNAGDAEGFREGGDHSRLSGSAQLSHRLNYRSRLRFSAAYTRIRQRPAGASGIRPEDFERDIGIHYTPISFRNVNALRVSAEYQRATRRGLLSLRPYARVNRMDVLPNWTLTFDPLVWDTRHKSLGMMTTYHAAFGQTSVIAGFDTEVSPGSRYEQRIVPERSGRTFVGYEEGEPLYDYDVTFSQVSPFLRAERLLVQNVRLSIGLRLDHLAYAYSTHLQPNDSGIHRRPDDADVSYTHMSPKAGLVWTPASGLSLYGSYRHAFRIPSENQLFRPGPSEIGLDLKPVRADQIEIGLRVAPLDRLSAEITTYRLVKRDDIVRFEREDGTRIEQNTGETTHRGIELSLHVSLFAGLKAIFAGSVSQHDYGFWQPAPDVNYTDKEIQLSPREVVQARLEYRPLFAPRTQLRLEWQHVGLYWMDASNQVEYPGHDLLFLGGRLRIVDNLDLFVRVANLTDRRYAERAIYNSFRGEEWTPGAPRAFYGGLQYALDR